jgi:RNA polymerase sigma-70 factor (ECF subfamily)
MPTQVVESYNDYPDETLLGLVHRQDMRAYELLYDRHAQVVYNLLVRIVREASAAEELVQEVFWVVWQRADQYQGAGTVAAWLYRIARNKGLDHLRRQRVRPQPAPAALETLERSMRYFTNSAENEVEQSWRRQQVTQALESIPNEQRHCLELAFFEGLSQREIAARTRTPLGTVKTRMRIGMEKLERILRAVGYIEGEV